MPRFIRVRTFLAVLAVATLTPLLPPATASAQMAVDHGRGFEVAQASGPAVQVQSQLYKYNTGAIAYLDIWNSWDPSFRVWTAIRLWPNGVFYLYWYDQSIRQYRYWTWSQFVPQSSVPASGGYVIIGSAPNTAVRSLGNPTLDNSMQSHAQQLGSVWLRPDCHLYGCYR